jgi:LuxR family maltose regulon positive regulatory protein
MAETMPVRPLLKTKFFLPRARAGLVVRPRLTARLDAGVQRKLTLISAPPGFGKTTVLSEWRTTPSGSQFPLAWLSLDEGDNDPVRFWFYVAHALETVRPGIGQEALVMLGGAQPAPVENVVMALINSIAEVPLDFALVLDDYHLIESAVIHEAMAFLLEHLPPQMHLILTTRADPPLPLARLRASGEMAELRVRDLRFTPAEAAELLARGLGLPSLDPTVAGALADRTEGWAAGLQLAALSLQTQEDAAGFAADLAGSHRYVMDYLVEEVLQRQPAEVQEFLLETSLLDRLCGPLCDAVTGRSDGQAMLERLEQASLFTFALDNERRWYRYHHLFADVLKARLRQSGRARVTGLYGRASDWYAASGMLVDAFHASVAADDHDHAAVLLAEVAESLWRQGEQFTLRTMLEALPAALVQRRAALCLLQARLRLTTLNLDEMGAWLDQAESALQGNLDGPQVLRGQVMALRAVLTRLKGDPVGAAELSLKAREALGFGPELTWLSTIAGNLVMAYHMLGRTEEALAELDEAARLSKAAGDVFGGVPTVCLQAELLEARGELQRALDKYQEALALGGGRGARMPSAGWAHVGMARLYLEWDDEPRAELHLAQAREWARRSRHHDTLFRVAVFEIARYCQQGETAQARRVLQEARDVVATAPVQSAILALAGLDAFIALCEGKIDQAVRLLEGAMPGQPLGAMLGLMEPSGWARLRIVRGEAAQGAAELEQLAAAVEAGGQAGAAVMTLVPAALCRQASGDRVSALADLRKALTLAEPEGWVRTFTGEGAPMVPLLRSLAAESGYVARLLSLLNAADPGEPSQAGLPEPLSDRELEILRLLAAGLGNLEIAEQSFIAVGTVKRHVHNILGKLEAADRTEAVDRARALGLLPR